MLDITFPINQNVTRPVFKLYGVDTLLDPGDELTDYLINSGYKWSGHTHVGETDFCLMPSDADYETMWKFRQIRSVIYNSVGKFYVFGEEE